MKNRIQLILGLWLLLLIVAGCSYRDILDDYPVAGVKITLDWKGVTEKLPEGVRCIFYSNDGAGRRIDNFLSVTGGEMSVPPGHYSVVVYNFDSQSILIKGDESYETIEAYTNYCSSSRSQNMVWGPDALYVVNIDDIEIRDTDGMAMELTWKPKAVVQTNPFSLKVKRLENVASISGNIEGMANCYLLGKGYGKSDGCTIHFEAGKGDGAIEGEFTTFGMPGVIGTRADNEVTMKLMLMKIDNTVQEVKIDITEVVATTSPPAGEGEVGEVIPPPIIELPEDTEIEVDEVTAIPDGGGIGGSVDDWGNEENVTLQ